MRSARCLELAVLGGGKDMDDMLDRRLTRRDILRLGAYGAVAGSLAACAPAALPSSPATSGSAPITTPPASPVTIPSQVALKLGHGFTVDHPLHITWLEMAQAINLRTEGAVKIDFFPNSTRGTQAELKDQLALGAPIIIGYAFADGAVHVPDWAIFEAPFNFASHEEAVKVAKSPLFDELAEQLFETVGWRIIARNFDNGPRHIINKARAVTVPADLQGLKIRVPQVPIYVDMINVLGATPVPLPLPEIYTGLQQGLIDGAEGQVASSLSLNLQEVAKHFALTGHIWQNAGMAGGTFYNSLSADLRTIIEEEASKSGDVYWSRVDASTAQGLDRMRAAGVAVTEIDVAPWRAATEPVYEKLAPTLTPGVIDRFRTIRDG